MKRFFMMDIYGVDRMTKEAKDSKTPTTFFWDMFGYYPDIVKEIDNEGGVIRVIKDIRE